MTERVANLILALTLFTVFVGFTALFTFIERKARERSRKK